MHRVLAFLGSMSLAVTLLVIVSIASVIGTVLQQNQNYSDYKIRFGEFYFEVFKQLGLYDVYKAPWFLFIMAFLLVSVTTCVVRQSPSRLRQIKNWNPIKRGRAEQVYNEQSNVDRSYLLKKARVIFKDAGYKLKMADDKIIARKNRFHPLGYIFTHLAIVLIIVGALIDSNPITQYKMLDGSLQLETENKLVSELPENRFLPVDNMAFRGNVNISEGGSASVLFINHKNGYVVQRLPFEVQVDDFRIEHYDNGQPKSFESDIKVRALDDSVNPVSATISVNKPLHYMGVDIFQASFSDGGSQLDLELRDLRRAYQTKPMHIEVGKSQSFDLGTVSYRLEMDDFRLFNIEDFAEEGETPVWRNVGPSVNYKLRQPDGSAIEYISYQIPVNIEGSDFYYFAYRSRISDPFVYVRIPADPMGELNWFNQFYANLSDSAIRTEAVTQLIKNSLDKDTQQSADAIRGANELFNLFVDRGFTAIDDWVTENVDAENRENVLDHYIRIVRMANEMIFFRTLTELNIQENMLDSDQIGDFFVNSVTAASEMSEFPIGIVAELRDYKHIQATGLQMTKSPGRILVYPGCLLLIIGVFIMFYFNEKRIMLVVNPRSDSPTEWDIIGKADKRREDFHEEVDDIRQQLRTLETLTP